MKCYYKLRNYDKWTHLKAEHKRRFEIYFSMSKRIYITHDYHVFSKINYYLLD